MKWEFEFIKVENYIRVTSEGIFTAQDQQRLVEELMLQSYWRKGMPVLFDNRNLDYSSGGVEAIKEASSYHKDNDTRIGNGKAALLMKSVTDFRLGRQYEMFTDEEISVNVHIFLDENQALRWLLY